MSARARITAAVLATGIAALLGLAGAAGPAQAQPAAGRAAAAAARAGGTAGPSLTMAITSVSPQTARPHSVITVTGEVANHSLTAMSGVSVRLLYGLAFTARDLLDQYASGSGLPAQTPYTGPATAVRGPIPANGAAAWRIRVRSADLPLTGFGVYPLAAEALDASATVLATSRSYLPYWPSRHSARAMPVSWLWPLIDTPDQAVCPGLLTGQLAASLAGDGRLAGLLDAGASYGRQAALTWAVDPALLTAAATMTSRYRVGAGPHCNRGESEPASQAAAAWLARLRTVTAGRPVMVTPYADIDVAALTRQGMNDDIASAFRLGRADAGTILHRSFSSSAAAAGQQSLTGYAWPADGIANFQTLGVLAVNGITSVVLAGHTMPPARAQGFTPSAVTKTPDGENGSINVLLSDDTLTRLLAGAGPGPASRARISARSSCSWLRPR